ncbi:MAG: polyprenyl synthetase family protein [Desulfosudaceae bacterium]
MTTNKNTPPDRTGQLADYLADRRERIETALLNMVKRYVAPGRLRQAMLHSLSAGGKRLRPILCMATAESVGGEAEATLPAGCALEMIHTYSLIHDDLPAVDNDDLRRGQPACHVAFDEATAIFAGDALHTLAFQVLSEPEYSLDDPVAQLAVINVIARATGTDGMIEGQMQDILAQSARLDEVSLREIHCRKTGALIRAAVFAGARIGGAAERQLSALDDYAGQVGLAFQVLDDLLDIQGDPALMGKAVGADNKRHKATYPGLMGPDRARNLAEDLVKNSLRAIESFDIKADPLRDLARYIIERQS